MYDNLKQLLNRIKVTVPEEMGRDIINNIVKEVVQQYNLEVNNVEFDFERIYKKGYEDKENWEDDYVMSYEIISEFNAIIDEIELYKFKIECC